MEQKKTLHTYLRKQDTTDDTPLAKSDSVASSRELAGLNDQNNEEPILLWLRLTCRQDEHIIQMLMLTFDVRQAARYSVDC